MRLAISVVCDHASVDQIGRLSLDGIWGRIDSPTVPVRFVRFYFAAVFEIEKAEVEVNQQLLFRCFSPSNVVICEFGPIPLDANARSALEFEDGGIMAQVIFQIGQMDAFEYGRYRFVTICDGVEVGEARFSVRPPKVQ
jgi:hypothetical protein